MCDSVIQPSFSMETQLPLVLAPFCCLFKDGSRLVLLHVGGMLHVQTRRGRSVGVCGQMLESVFQYHQWGTKFLCVLIYTSECFTCRGLISLCWIIKSIILPLPPAWHQTMLSRFFRAAASVLACHCNRIGQVAFPGPLSCGFTSAFAAAGAAPSCWLQILPYMVIGCSLPDSLLRPLLPCATIGCSLQRRYTCEFWDRLKCEERPRRENWFTAGHFIKRRIKNTDLVVLPRRLWALVLKIVLFH